MMIAEEEDSPEDAEIVARIREKLLPQLNAHRKNRNRDGISKVGTQILWLDRNYEPVRTETWQARAARGADFLKTGDFVRSVAAYSLAIELAPQEHDLYFRRALGRLSTGEHEKAKADLTQAIHLEDTSAEYHYGRGQGREALGDVKRAHSDFGQAVTLEAENGRYHADRARTYFQLGNKKKARRSLELAIARDYEPAIAQLAFLEEEDGQEWPRCGIGVSGEAYYKEKAPFCELTVACPSPSLTCAGIWPVNVRQACLRRRIDD